MTKKVIFLLAGSTPTNGELADIAKIEKYGTKAFDVVVRKGDVAADMNYGAGKEAADYVAFTSPMTKPTAYSGVTTFDPAKPPALQDGMPTTAAMLVSGQKYAGCTITGSGTFITPTIVNGVVTGIVASSS